MICPKCNYERTDNAKSLDWECPQCGVIYSKYQKAKAELNSSKTQGRYLSVNNLPDSGRQNYLKWVLIALVVLGAVYSIITHQFNSEKPVSLEQTISNSQDFEQETLYKIPEMRPANNDTSSSKYSEYNGNKTLKELRDNFKTKLANQVSMEIPVDSPPGNSFKIVQYPSKIGPLSAYLSLPLKRRGKHPAIIWILGGFSNSIDSTPWVAAVPDNDQSARAFRERGIITMYPSLRGGNMNPGHVEGFYGEVDDIISAYEFLNRQTNVDSKRIYLGGHNTGGTLSLLVAEYTDKFRAVFSLGPNGDIKDYEAKYFKFNLSDEKEWKLRSPIYFLWSINSPTYVFEGVNGNINSLMKMQEVTSNKKIRFFAVPDGDHLSIISSLTKIIADKIIQDNSNNPDIRFTKDEINRI